MNHLPTVKFQGICYPKHPGSPEISGLLHLHSYSFRMGLEPSFLFDREGSGLLGLVFEGVSRSTPPCIFHIQTVHLRGSFPFGAASVVGTFFLCWRKQVLFLVLLVFCLLKIREAVEIFPKLHPFGGKSIIIIIIIIIIPQPHAKNVKTTFQIQISNCSNNFPRTHSLDFPNHHTTHLNTRCCQMQCQQILRSKEAGIMATDALKPGVASAFSRMVGGQKIKIKTGILTS